MFFPEDFRSSYVLVRDCRLSADHFPNISVYVNPEAADAYVDSIYPFAQGTVCVKIVASEEDCSNPIEYVAMRKGPPGTAPSSGDWEWQTIRPDRSVAETGILSECISCHADCTEGRDFMCTNP